MKRILFALLGLMLLSQPSMAYEKEINSVSAELSEAIAASVKKTIAVVDFTDLQGNVTELGRFLAEEFSVILADTGGGFEVIDRTHLKSIMQEHKLTASGVIDPSTARKLGEIAGVESLITGTITPFGDTIRVSIKILDTNSAKIIGAKRINLAKTDAFIDLLNQNIFQVDAGPKPGNKLMSNQDSLALKIVELKNYKDKSKQVFCNGIDDCEGFAIIDGLAILREVFDAGPVVCSHPPSKNEPAIFEIDVKPNSILSFKVHSHPSGNSLLQVWAGEDMLFGENISGGFWKPVSIPIPRDISRVQLRNIATGWAYEYLYFDFNVAKSN